MNTVQIAIWVGTAVGLAGLGVAFFRSERLGVRLGTLGAFGVFYLAVAFSMVMDETWFNVATVSVLLIAFGSRMKKPSAPPSGTAVPEEPTPREARKGEPES
jgi:predicted anti-sigma-YlaC factor YlaD